MNKTEADYLDSLIAFPSVSSDKEASKECAEFCNEFFSKNGMHSEITEYSGYPNVVATSIKTKTPKVLLQCHMDVVPADSKMFSMKREGNKLLGRGAFDMKFACASYMKLVRILGSDIKNYDFGIMLSFDEEIGGRNGVGALLNDQYGCDVCILPDSGKDWHLETSANGAWFIKLSKEGKNAHASAPQEGINAAEILMEALSGIYKIREKYSPNELTLSLTQVNGGKAMNQIPDSAEATLDIRFRSEKIYKELRSQIEKIINQRNIKLETLTYGTCMNVDTRDPVVTEFIAVAEEVLDKKIKTCHSIGATDGRYFCEKNIPCIVIQPNGGGRHSDSEWVDSNGVEDLTKILVKFIKKQAII